jgi:inorganic pyrophosphatase
MKLDRLPAYEGDQLNVIVETPRGSRTKYKYDPKTSLFVAHKFLPAGMVYPANFGFIPSTRGEDGDPVDVLILTDEPSYPGCLMRCRLLGVIEAAQIENGDRFKNDRLIAVPAQDKAALHLRSLEDVGAGVLRDLEEFFAAVNRAQGRQFKPLGNHGPARARKLIQAASGKS